jgi:Fe-Mn family superoxide dismutase
MLGNLGAGALVAGAGMLTAAEIGLVTVAHAADAPPQYTLPPLPYANDALEPYIDAETMRIHHDLHHKAYVDGLNKSLAQLAAARTSKDTALVGHWIKELEFNAAGDFLHTLFWNTMGPNAGGEPAGDLAAQINSDFGDFGAFKAQFSAAAAQVQGSGWAVLGWEPLARQLLILQVEKHQVGIPATVTPLIPIDVWEHAYYLKHQNRRAEYITAWWNVINWTKVTLPKMA